MGKYNGLFSHSLAPLSCQCYFFAWDTPPSEVKILLHGNLRHGSFISSVAAGHTNQKEARWYFHSSSSKAHTLSFFIICILFAFFAPEVRRGIRHQPWKPTAACFYVSCFTEDLGDLSLLYVTVTFYDLHWSSRCTTIIVQSTLSSGHFSLPPLQDMDKVISDSSFLPRLIQAAPHWKSLIKKDSSQTSCGEMKNHSSLCRMYYFLIGRCKSTFKYDEISAKWSTYVSILSWMNYFHCPKDTIWLVNCAVVRKEPGLKYISLSFSLAGVLK